MKFAQGIRSIWTASGFSAADVDAYAASLMADEARQGVASLSLFSLLLLVGASALNARLGLGSQTIYTFLALAALSLHIMLSTRMTKDLRAQYLLAMVLLVINGTALVLLAHKTGTFSATMLSAIALLFMVVPMVPWGLREALAVTTMIYFVFTASTLSTPVQNFSAETLWSLQFLMLGAGTISLALVARSVSTRKHEIEARYELERSHRQMKHLSMQDPLTGTWNRRYLDTHFDDCVAHVHGMGESCHFAVFDIDRFKQINDRHGHAFGDQLLQRVACAYGGVLEQDDLLVRLGGDEFAMLMRDADVRKRLWQASGALQAYVRELGAAADVRPTVSVGLLEIRAGRPLPLDRAYTLADTALYEAKRGGGNRIVDGTVAGATDNTESIADGSA